MSKLKQSLETVVGSAKDPRLKERARASATSVIDAIGATFSEVGGEISNRKGEGGEGDATA